MPSYRILIVAALTHVIPMLFIYVLDCSTGFAWMYALANAGIFLGVWVLSEDRTFLSLNACGNTTLSTRVLPWAY